MAALCHMVVRRPSLEVATKSNQKDSKLTGKNIGVALLLWRAWKCAFTAFSGCVDITKVPGCHLLQQISFRRGSQSR